ALRRRGRPRAFRVERHARGRWPLGPHLPRGGALRPLVPRALPDVVRDRRARAQRGRLGGVPGAVCYPVPPAAALLRGELVAPARGGGRAPVDAARSGASPALPRSNPISRR